MIWPYNLCLYNLIKSWIPFGHCISPLYMLSSMKRRLSGRVTTKQGRVRYFNYRKSIQDSNCWQKQLQCYDWWFNTGLDTVMGPFMEVNEQHYIELHSTQHCHIMFVTFCTYMVSMVTLLGSGVREEGTWHNISRPIIEMLLLIENISKCNELTLEIEILPVYRIKCSNFYATDFWTLITDVEKSNRLTWYEINAIRDAKATTGYRRMVL